MAEMQAVELTSEQRQAMKIMQCQQKIIDAQIDMMSSIEDCDPDQTRNLCVDLFGHWRDFTGALDVLLGVGKPNSCKEAA